MPEMVVWVTKPSEKDVPDLEEVGERVQGLGCVSGTDVRTEGSVMRVSFEGGKAEQEEIKHAIRESGYEIFKVSHSED